MILKKVVLVGVEIILEWIEVYIKGEEIKERMLVILWEVLFCFGVYLGKFGYTL